MKIPVLLGGIALVALGSGATYFVMRRQTAPAAPISFRAPASEISTASEVSLTLSNDAIARAGIVVERVGESGASGGVRVPATIEAHGYRSVVVTPIVPGRIVSVSSQLGEHVRRGQTLARLYSPELSEAQSRYLAARAELGAHERELRRTEKLAELGSASREELERIHAEHTAALTTVESLRSRLTLLGMGEGHIDKLASPSDVTASIAIPAPIDGVITQRDANVGLNVDPSAKLFTVVDLSMVWVVGNVFERDLGRVRAGNPARITISADPAARFDGKVSYIDPQVRADTRTAQVRVELPNRGSQLRLGMLAQMEIGEVSEGRVTLPAESVQMVGDRSVVYLADPAKPGRFVEREIERGAAIGDRVEIVDGLKPGDTVVVKGSFALRAERDRLGLRQPPAEASATARREDRLRVTVSEKGFEPTRITLQAGAPSRLTFVRTTDATCATEIAIPALGIKRSLPLNQPVEIELTPQKRGEIMFACGMDMFSGTIVVQ